MQGQISTVNTPSEQATTHEKYSTLIPILVAGAFFMENLDGTIIATALPQMAKSFHANPVDLSSGMTAYMLTLAVFIPVSGWLADRLGARTVFTSAIALFTFASILCGISNGALQFTAFRVLQGIGGAMMVPIGRLVVLRVTEKKDLLRAMSFITWPGLVAPVLGPPLGGFITDRATWRWIFYLNVPLGIIGIALALLWIRNQHEDSQRRFDWLGFGLGGTCCIAFMYGLELMGRQHAEWSAVGAFLGYSALAGWLVVRHMRRVEEPLVNLDCLKVHTFVIAMAGGSLFRVAIMASPFLLPLMFQVTFGLTAFQSGLYVLAMFAGNLTMKSVTTPVLRKYGFRTVLLVNGIVAALLILLCGFLRPSTPVAVIVAVLFLHGLTRSMQFTSYNTLGFVDIGKPLMSSATSFAAVVQQMGMGLGVAVGAVALRAAAWFRNDTSGLPTLNDFHIAFWLVAVLASLAIIDSFGLAHHAGAEVTGHAKG